MRLRHFDENSLADGSISKTARTRSNAGSLPMIILRISTATARQQIRSAIQPGSDGLHLSLRAPQLEAWKLQAEESRSLTSKIIVTVKYRKIL
jgi:hypothetical protein